MFFGCSFSPGFVFAGWKNYCRAKIRQTQSLHLWRVSTLRYFYKLMTLALNVLQVLQCDALPLAFSQDHKQWMLVCCVVVVELHVINAWHVISSSQRSETGTRCQRFSGQFTTCLLWESTSAVAQWLAAGEVSPLSVVRKQHCDQWPVMLYA